MKALRVVVLLFLITSLAPLFAQAHTLKTMGDVGVLLHVDPDDEPLAGETATLYVDIKSAQKNASCGCTLSISQNSATIYTTTLKGASAAVPYVFPAAGIYQITVASTGAPMPAFTLTFDQRVMRPASQESGVPLWVYTLMGAVLVCIVGYATLKLTK